MFPYKSTVYLWLRLVVLCCDLSLCVCVTMFYLDALVSAPSLAEM